MLRALAGCRLLESLECCCFAVPAPLALPPLRSLKLHVYSVAELAACLRSAPPTLKWLILVLKMEVAQGAQGEQSTPARGALAEEAFVSLQTTLVSARSALPALLELTVLAVRVWRDEEEEKLLQCLRAALPGLAISKTSQYSRVSRGFQDFDFYDDEDNEVTHDDICEPLYMML